MSEVALHVSSTFDYEDAAGFEATGQVTDKAITIYATDLRCFKGKQLIGYGGGSTREALAQGEVTIPGCCWFKNLHATAAIRLYNASSSGVQFMLILPGEGWSFRIGDDITQIYARSDDSTGTGCLLEYILCSI